MYYISYNSPNGPLIVREKTFSLDLSFFFDERAQRLFLPVDKTITLSGIFKKKISRKSGLIAVMADCRFSTDYGNFYIGHMYWTGAEAIADHASGDYITAEGLTYMYEHQHEKDSRFRTSVGFQVFREM